LLETWLAEGERIVDKEGSDARRSLLMLEGGIRVERERITAETSG